MPNRGDNPANHAQALRAKAPGGPTAAHADLLDKLYRRHWRDLCGFIRAKYGAGPPDPEDVAQTTFLRFAALPQPETVADPKAFLFKTASNIVLDYHRHEGTVRRFAQETQAQESPEGNNLGPQNVLLARERLALLEACIRKLPQRQAQFLLAHRLHGLSYSDIARRAGMTPAGVRKIILAAVAACEAALDDAQDDL